MKKTTKKEEFEEKVRETHLQIAKDFHYGYDEAEDQMWITVNHDPTRICVDQAYTCPL